MFDLAVPFIRQTAGFDCWYAALRMLVKFRHGPTAEPLGHPTAEYEGMIRQSAREAIKDQGPRGTGALSDRQVMEQLKLSPSRGLSQAEFDELAGYNGLAAPILPPYDGIAKTGGWTTARLEALLRVHGPLWCALGYRHIVVIKGIDAQDQVLVHDPQNDHPDEPYPVRNINNLLTWTANCVMYLPAIPNSAAVNPV